MKDNIYDFIVVGAGLFGATFAHLANKTNKKVLIVEKKDEVGGMCATYPQDNYYIHKFGAHIFHTNNKKIWNFINQFDTFVGFINQPLAKYNNQLYNLPFNMNTFYKVFGTATPELAKAAIDIVNIPIHTDMSLEEYARATIGTTLYNMFVKQYTEKQWGKRCNELPASILQRIPLRFTYNNNYFDDLYQGVPQHGYSYVIKQMIKDIDILYNTTYKDLSIVFPDIHAPIIIYTGQIDSFFDYRFGTLEYRSLIFKEKEYEVESFFGSPVINYTDQSVPYTRTIEHKLFLGDVGGKSTIVSYEQPIQWKQGITPFYPIPTEQNKKLYQQYKAFAQYTCPNIIFCGRLGYYEYLNMDKTIKRSFDLYENLTNH